MFRFIVKYLGFLKRVPFAAWLTDALMFIWHSVFRKEVLLAIDAIESEVSRWDDISVTLHKYGGLQFNHHNREIGHVHSNGILDILFSRATKQMILEKGLASDHHVFPGSGWISFYIRKRGDAEAALRLLLLSYSDSRKGRF